MPKEGVVMRKIQEGPRLNDDLGRSNREITCSWGTGSSSVNDYVKRAGVAKKFK
jgi:hypothetical protein